MVCQKSNLFWAKSGLSEQAGHGGFDPGKVGADGTLEKDINLEIALLLKERLETERLEEEWIEKERIEKGRIEKEPFEEEKLEQEQLEKVSVDVILTRTEDKAVGQVGEKGSKQEDMKKRVEIINESGAILAVSIHQNSFTDAASKGAQVFYHTQSEEGAVLAKYIQEQMKRSVGGENHRMEKANDSYYLLKKTECPIVIVECGFLSNPEEAALLQDRGYQEKIAEGIAEGIFAYLKGKKEVNLIFYAESSRIKNERLVVSVRENSKMQQECYK